jgi:hypothetical protein
MTTARQDNSVDALNATYLFRQPSNYHHNSESWWTAFFSLVMLYLAKTSPSFSLPVYAYSTDTYRKVGELRPGGFSFAKMAAEARLCAATFNLESWPNQFLATIGVRLSIPDNLCSSAPLDA